MAAYRRDGGSDHDTDTTDLPLFPAVAAMAGQTWRLQFWFRDQNPGQTSNFTDGVAITIH